MFQTTTELEQYVEESNSSIYYLILKIGGIENVHADHAVSHLGKAQGICNLLRALPAYHIDERSKKAIPVVPQQILLTHGVSHERVIRQRLDDKFLSNCIFDVASVANTHLEKARKLSSSITPAAKRFLLPSVSIGRYLERLRQCDFHLSHPQMSKRDAFLPFVYYWNSLRKTY